MRDEMFWCVYFLLVYNKTGNILVGEDPTKQMQTPTKQPTNNSHHTPYTPQTPQTPQDVEEYFDKLFLKQMAEISSVDDGIEPDDDNYFSPHKFKYGSTRDSNLSSENINVET